MKRELIREIMTSVASSPNRKAGLFEGKMGICLSLYLVNKTVQASNIEKCADKLLDEVVEDISGMHNLSFANGLTGIGWAINKLHENGCIWGDVDDILFNIDAVLYREVICGTDVAISDLSDLLGTLVYLVDRVNNHVHNRESTLHTLDVYLLRMVIDKLSHLMPSFLQKINKDVYPSATWAFPILFYSIEKALCSGTYTNKIDNMMRLWETQICTVMPFYHLHRLALANSLYSLNLKLKHGALDRHVDMLYTSVDFKRVEDEIIPNIHSVNVGWCYAVAILRQTLSIGVNRSDIITKCKRMIYDIVKVNVADLRKHVSGKVCPKDISLINGMSGLLLLFNL